MKSTIEFEHGDETCEIEPGKQCRWLTKANFGQTSVCYVTGEVLLEADKSTLRSTSCLNDFSSSINRD